MSTRDEFYFKSKDGINNIHAVIWRPEDVEIVGVIQICHGMVEYIERYEDFALFLNKNGYVVVGSDHLGHGQSVKNKEYGYFADNNGDNILVEDVHTLRELMGEKYEKLPYIMLGHSMGSFILRKYITLYGDGITGAVMCGTGNEPNINLVIVKAICNFIGFVKNKKYKSNMVDALVLGRFNKKDMKGNKWLTKDEAIVEKYNNDKKCQFIFSVGAYADLMRLILYIKDKKNINKVPKQLPILIVSGSDDPVGAMGRAPVQVRDNLVEAGVTDVTLRIYESDRHEVLNETDRQDVYEYILKWINNTKDTQRK